MNRIALGLSVIPTAIFGPAGCNTIAGAGHDIEDAGQDIQNTANKHKSQSDQ
ncbi:entericidin A/B family lipoprotein [Salinisphaera sp. Q1T1-3]|uniref:entericidin A/B family lipoprotein n=1 Tax=Salinisphaera sp. Q1T1-3 TaxID=2321229 RepID=UPI000E7324FD|nr:entericidin A/B family lipoprotein [Salinisphaera sp. Q1T1-3]RJS91168.1 entericidin, EcnA/B family [Salinisphaera sp. Q1T1-3]